MTPEQKMQAIVEAAEECWHYGTGIIPHGFNCRACDTCGDFAVNPSPTDLPELLRLSDKLGLRLKITTNYDGAGSCLVIDVGGVQREHMNSAAEAVLNVLYESVTRVVL